jgi:hypothetical protein
VKPEFVARIREAEISGGFDAPAQLRIVLEGAANAAMVAALSLNFQVAWRVELHPIITITRRQRRGKIGRKQAARRKQIRTKSKAAKPHVRTVPHGKNRNKHRSS